MAFSGAWNPNYVAIPNSNQLLSCAALLCLFWAIACLFDRHCTHLIAHFLRQKLRSILFLIFFDKFKEIRLWASVAHVEYAAAQLHSTEISTAGNERTHSPRCYSSQPCNLLGIPKEALWRIFERWDEDGDGMVNGGHIQFFLQNLGLHDDNNIVSHRDGDRGDQKFINFGDFCSLCLSVFNDNLQEKPEGVLMEAFNVFYENGDGFITHEELQQVLLRLGFKEAHDLDFCRNMIKQFDMNCDGRIDFMEFQHMISTPLR